MSDIPEKVDDELEEIAYDWAEEVIRWSKKSKNWPVERHIADAILKCLRIIYLNVDQEEFEEIKEIIVKKGEV